MPLLKRASERLEKMGIAIEVHMGPYGPYLHDPFLRRQRTYVYKSAEEADARPLATPIPARGQLGLWRWSGELPV